MKYQLTIYKPEAPVDPIRRIRFARNISELKLEVQDLMRLGWVVEIHQLVPVETHWADEIAAEVAA